jgi:hypothetical protein
MKKQFLGEELQRMRLRVFLYKLAEEIDNAIPLSLLDDCIRVPTFLYACMSSQ